MLKQSLNDIMNANLMGHRVYNRSVLDPSNHLQVGPVNYYFNPQSAKLIVYKAWILKGFFHFYIIISVLS